MSGEIDAPGLSPRSFVEAVTAFDSAARAVADAAERYGHDHLITRAAVRALVVARRKLDRALGRI